MHEGQFGGCPSCISWGVSPGPTGSVLFGTVRLHAVDSAGESSPLDIEVISLYDGTAGDPQAITPATVTDGDFSIGRWGSDIYSDADTHSDAYSNTYARWFEWWGSSRNSSGGTDSGGAGNVAQYAAAVKTAPSQLWWRSTTDGKERR